MVWMSAGVSLGNEPQRPLAPELDSAFGANRRELTGYCYRMLGAASEAEDAVQETLTRAWRSFDRFEGRSGLRSWLYRIATNVCIDMHRSPQRRARPMEMGPATTVAEAEVLNTLPEAHWITPIPDERVIDVHGDPADVAAARESIRLAFITALQHLPPKQRSVLLLCDVLSWPAADAATLLDMTVAAVNSALQRARATLAKVRGERLDPVTDTRQRAVIARYVDAFERYDVDELVELLRDDVVMSMPPHNMWLQGRHEVGNWMVGPGAGCEGARLVPIAVNGTAGFGNYRRSQPGVWEPFAIQVIEVQSGVITGYHNFLFPECFEAFGLPLRLEDR